jgi:hypothetical protein
MRSQPANSYLLNLSDRDPWFDDSLQCGLGFDADDFVIGRLYFVPDDYSWWMGYIGVGLNVIWHVVSVASGVKIADA